MEVLSLALLAVASGGLLLKAKNDSKKEGFVSESNPPLFSQTVRNKSPQDHVEYIETTTQKSKK